MVRRCLWSLILITTGLWWAVGCTEPVSSGEHANPIEHPADFVSEEHTLYVATHRAGLGAGMSEIQLDGTGRRDLYDRRFYFRSVADDASIWVLTDGHDYLHLLHDGETRPELVTSLDFPVADAILSPGYEFVALTRPRTGPDPDNHNAIYRLDVETRDIEQLETTTDGDAQLHGLHWSLDGESLYYMLQPDRRPMRLDIDTGERVELDDWESHHDDFQMTSRQSPATCPDNPRMKVESTRGEHDGLVLRENAQTRHLVTIDGYNPGRSPTVRDLIPTYFFSPSCEYVVYVYDLSVWIVDISSGVVGKLMDGEAPFYLNSQTE